MTADLPDRIGVCHAAGRYSIGPEDHLTAGAARILELGSRVIKLFLRKPLDEMYPFADGWPDVATLSELARTPMMSGVFDLPYTTFLLSCDGIGVAGDWRTAQTAEQAEQEARQLEELTRHLLERHADRDVTFVIQNWETDWAIRERFVIDGAPAAGAFGATVARLNNRQEAVERGRAGTTSRARVLHAAEVNLVFGGADPAWSVTTNVLPHTRLDAYSYSAYETTLDGGERFVDALELIRDNTEPSASCGRDNVFVGEFGAPEVVCGKERSTAITRRTLDDALAFGCPWVLFWEIFDNETTPEPLEGADFPGHWVLRPDGSRSAAGDVLAEYLV